jgi:hypothetical protein
MRGYPQIGCIQRYNIVSGGDLKDAAVKLDAAASQVLLTTTGA